MSCTCSCQQCGLLRCAHKTVAVAAAVEASTCMRAAGRQARDADCMRRRWTIGDFHDAYRSGHTSPEDVAERILQCIADSESIDPPMRLFIASDAADIRRQAAAAAQRQAPLPRAHNSRTVTEVSSTLTCSGPACTASCQHAGLSVAAFRRQSLHGVHGFGLYMAHPVVIHSLKHSTLAQPCAGKSHLA